jgi:hypothetical protein
MKRRRIATAAGAALKEKNGDLKGVECQGSFIVFISLKVSPWKMRYFLRQIMFDLFGFR